MDSLSQLLDERWLEYLQACSENLPGNEKHSEKLKLYAAVRRLSEAVGDRTVAEAILEISSNLMACEQMAIVVFQDDAKSDPFIRSVGLTQERSEALRSNAERIVEEVAEGRVYLSGGTETTHPFLASLGITAQVPLWQDRKMKGAIVFYDLLPQRNGLDTEDHALLKLLAVYAGPCLFHCWGDSQEPVE